MAEVVIFVIRVFRHFEKITANAIFILNVEGAVFKIYFAVS